MPQQLIYTSAPRGLVAGRSGYCTVARSATMREALVLQLEKLSYYQHLSLAGGRDRPVFACRMVDIRGARFHVLTRIQDAGLDFTGRTNFVAHHLVFAPEEIRESPTPPVILRDWTGWAKSWTKEPQLLEGEDWSGLNALRDKSWVPARTWQQVTGDAVNGYGLLEARAGTSFRVDDQPDETVLGLFAESVELLEVRDSRRDFRSAAWQQTFTTSMQEQDNPSDFRWRCLHSDNPAASRFAGPDCRPLSEVRAAKCTVEESTLARTGRQGPRIVVEPEDVRVVEGEPVRLSAKAEGIPSPTYQWFALDRAGDGQAVPGGTAAELAMQNPPVGVSRYVVRASNSGGEVTSKVATVSIEQKLRLSQSRSGSGTPEPARPASRSYVKSEDDIERQRRKLAAEQAQVMFQKGLRRKRILAVCGVMVGLAVVGIVAWEVKSRPPQPVRINNSSNVIAVTNRQVQEQTNRIAAAANTDRTALEQDAAPASDIHAKHPSTILADTESVLPKGWNRICVGNVLHGSAEYFPDASPAPRFDLTAAGTGLTGNEDDVLFVCKTNFGTEFIARLTHSKGDRLNLSTKRGIMVRESGSPSSPYLFVGVFANKIQVFRREMKKFDDRKVADMNGDLLWLKLYKKDTGSVSAAYSFDSIQWFEIAESFRIAERNPLLVGFVLCSGDSENPVDAHFIDLSPKEVSAKPQ